MTRRDEYENIDVMGALGELPCGALVEGFDLRYMDMEDEIEDEVKKIQDVILVRRMCNSDRRNKRAFKLKKLEEEGVMIEEGVRKGKKGKKGEEKDDD